MTLSEGTDHSVDRVWHAHLEAYIEDMRCFQSQGSLLRFKGKLQNGSASQAKGLNPWREEHMIYLDINKFINLGSTGWKEYENSTEIDQVSFVYLHILLVFHHSKYHLTNISVCLSQISENVNSNYRKLLSHLANHLFHDRRTYYHFLFGKLWSHFQLGVQVSMSLQ